MKRWGLGIIVILFGSLYALLATNQQNKRPANGQQANNSTIVAKKKLENHSAVLPVQSSNKLATQSVIISNGQSSADKLVSSVADQGDRTTVAGLLLQKTGEVLRKQIVYAKNSVEDIKLSTDGEGDFFVHLLNNQKYTLFTSDGVQLGSITVGDTQQVDNDEGIIELGRTFSGQSSSNYVQLKSYTIYFLESEVFWATANQVIVKGNQDVYVGDVVLADQGQNHSGAIAIKVTSVQHENDRTILNGTSITMTSLFQEIHSGSYGVFGAMRISPNTQIAKFNQSSDSLAVNDDQGNNFNVTLDMIPSLAVNYSNAHGMKQVAASFRINAKIQGSIRGNGAHFATYNLGDATISTDIPFITVNVPLTLTLGIQANNSTTVNVMAQYNSSMNLQMNAGEMTKSASHSVTTDLSGGTPQSISLGVGVAPAISIAGDNLLTVRNNLGFNDKIDADSNETQDGYFNAEIGSSLLDKTYSFNEGEPLFRTARMQVNTDTSAAVNELTLAPGETKLLYLPEYDKETDTVIFEKQGPITVTELSSGVYKVTVEKNATAGNTANLTFTSSANGHLFDSKAKIAVNVAQAANGSIGGYILDASQKIGIKNSRITLVSSTTGTTYTAISDDNGKYTITLPEGNYQSTVTASGYKTVSVKTVNIDAGETTTNIELSVDDTILHGIIKNSVSGENIAETKLYFRQGDNNTTSELVESATTAADGTFSLNLPVGDYTVEITKDGFVTSFKNITITAGNENIEFDGSLSSNESISSS